jgi:hypothetical protein
VAHRRFENALVSSGQCVLTSLLLGGTLHGFVQGTPCQMEVTREDGATFASYTTPGVVGAQAVELDDGTTPNSFKGCNLLFDRDLCFLAHNNGDASAISGGPTPPVGDGPLHVAATGSSMTLAGSISLPVATTFTQVSTLLKVCGAYDAGASFKEQDPHDCADADGNYSWWTFTSKTLSPPLSVAPGQSVAVSVQLSFS